MFDRNDLIAAAKKLWGEPTVQQRHEWRFGTHGSKSINLNDLVWFDHELQEGGGVVDLCQKAGIDMGSNGHDQEETSWIAYDYRDEHGDLLFQVVRQPGHKFIQRRPDGGEGWVYKLDDVRRVLYHLPEINRSNGTVFVVEGEKDADNLAKLGFLTTCNPGGVGKWRSEYSKCLFDKDVIILPDNDEPGIKHAEQVRMMLAGCAHSVRVVMLPGLGPKQDVSDWIFKGGTAAELLALVREPEQQKPATNLPWVWDKVDWDLYPIPEQEWTVPSRIPAQQVCLLSGHGATGKSTIGLYLAVAHCLGRDWMKSLPAPGPAFFIDAEDDISVIRRRLGAIIKHYGVVFQQVFDSGLHILPMAGEDTIMATTNRDGKIITTPFYKEVLERAADIKPAQIVLASAANFFAGNENDRSQVQQFIGHLKHLAIVTGGSVVLITHPSLTGLATHSILSGSTQWHNAVRARMVLKTVEDNGEDEQSASDLRVIEFPKNQYGPADSPITIRWKDGMFLPEPEAAPYEKAAKMARAEELFKTCLRRLLAEGRQVSPEPRAHNNAPAVFHDLPENEQTKCSKRELWAAMERLLKNRVIEIGTWGPASKVRKFLKFPDET